MTLVNLDKIERRFGDLVVLDGASFRVEDKDRIGIIGGNGVGKTTLIRILAGVDDPDRGERNARRNLRVGYDDAKLVRNRREIVGATRGRGGPVISVHAGVGNCRIAPR